MPSKAIVLTIQADFKSGDKSQGFDSRPEWFCLHFNPPPGPHPDAKLAGQWQLTMNVRATQAPRASDLRNTDAVSHEVIPGDKRLLLYFDSKPGSFENKSGSRYGRALVERHCRFLPSITPRVVALRSDRKANPSAPHNNTIPENALVYIKRSVDSQTYTAENGRTYILNEKDSAANLVTGQIYHLQITFPDFATINTLVARGWGFNATLFTDIRHLPADNYAVSENGQALTQIRANWMDVVEPDPSPQEMELVGIHQEVAAKTAGAGAAAAREPTTEAFVGLSTTTPVPSATPAPFAGVSATTPVPSATPAPARASAVDANMSETAASRAPMTRGSASTSDAPSAAHYPGNPLLEKLGEKYPDPMVRLARAKKAAKDYRVEDFTSTMEVPEYLTDFRSDEDLGKDRVEAFFDAPALIPEATDAMRQVAISTNAIPNPDRVARDRDLFTAFRAVEQIAKREAQKRKAYVNEYTNEYQGPPEINAAYLFTYLLIASGQLPGWGQAEEYIRDPNMYGKGTPATRAAMAAQSAQSSGAGGVKADSDQIQPQSVEELKESGDNLIRHVLTITNWVLHIEKLQKEEQPGYVSDGRTLYRILLALSKDTRWKIATENWLDSTKITVSYIINRDPTAFAAFRELTSRGVAWPHNPLVRRQIERAGFDVRPIMIHLDRSVCETCGVEVSGWRPWHNPWLHHDWSKRHPFAPPPGNTVRRAAMQ